MNYGSLAIFAKKENSEIFGFHKGKPRQENGIYLPDDYYLSPDFNLDGDINGTDKTLWFENNGISSRVPK